ncbi:CapA family protein [Paenibacillus hemerocallicola]|uniref:CapA family protein n=1 Tax=Paenibacillus hemerocallicola TaxID=1172614 RepID=A0A5C4SX71_9BACL|nr:CapA family protein [Paenibacillus hemerocallicola]TNJ60016.1 CapA family protein [Paenibacillus hemerocallicola]
MEHSSRKETYQRKRSRSKRKLKRRWVTSAFVVAFFSLVFILWLSYNGTGGGSAPPSDPDPKPQAGQGQAPSDGGGKSDPGSKTQPPGKEPDGNADSGTKKPAETDPSNTGTANTDATNGSTPSTGNVGQGGGNPEGTDKAPAVTTPPATGGTGATEDPNRVQLTFVGDVIFADNVETALKANGYDYPYRNVRDYLENADLTIANLETPLTERGTAAVKEYAYRSTPKALPAFREAGFDLVNLANNHILDYGTTGLLDTFDHLDKAGIRWFGAGRNAAEAFKPVIVEKKGIKIAFLGLSKVVPTQDWKAGKDRPGVADTYALKVPLDAIRDAKKQADLVIVVAHWGIERKDQPEKYQRDFAREYIDAGADLIVGGHPHVLQGFENYKGKWIAYSLGNFIFTMNENPLTWESVILQASCSKEGGCSLKTVPVLTKLANPEPMTGDAAAKLYDRLTGISFEAQVDKDGTVQTSSKK